MSPHVSEGDVVGDIVGWVVIGVLSVGQTVVGLFRIISYKKVVKGLLISEYLSSFFIKPKLNSELAVPIVTKQADRKFCCL